MKKTKRILTALTAAFLSVTAVSPYVSSAEEAPENKTLLAELEKRAEENLTDEGYVKTPAHAENMFRKASNASIYLGESIVGSDEQPELLISKVNPDNNYLYMSIKEGITDADVNNFVRTNFPDDEVFYASFYDSKNITELRSTLDIKDDMKSSNVKELVKALKDNNLIESAEISHGTFTTDSTSFFEYPISWFQSHDQYYEEFNKTEQNDIETTRQDIIDSYIAGDFECGEFGLVVDKDKLPEGVEYKDFDKCYNYHGRYMFTKGLYGLIPLTPEEAAKLDKSVLEASHFFFAKPSEMSIENQSNLIGDINVEIPVVAFRTSHIDVVRFSSFKGITYDVTNAVNGDANCDEKFSIADATAILQHLGNPDEYGLSLKGMYNADCGGVMDGVTAADAVFIQNELVKK